MRTLIKTISQSWGKEGWLITDRGQGWKVECGISRESEVKQYVKGAESRTLWWLRYG
jgi:hypothetical protein